MGLLANIHGFEQKLNNNYFEAIVYHKAIDYLIKSKHEPTSTRLVTLLDILNRYTGRECLIRTWLIQSST